jgi:hypothetical protein
VFSAKGKWLARRSSRNEINLSLQITETNPSYISFYQVPFGNLAMRRIAIVSYGLATIPVPLNYFDGHKSGGVQTKAQPSGSCKKLN